MGEVIRLELPSSDPSDPAWVDVNPEVTTEDWMAWRETKQAYALLSLVKNSIVAWNMTDKNNDILEVSIEVIRTLPVADFDLILSRLKTDNDDALVDRDRKNLILYLTAIKANQKPPVDPPLSYVFYVYRKEFHLSWQEFCNTPLTVVLRDIEFNNLEAVINNR